MEEVIDKLADDKAASLRSPWVAPGKERVALAEEVLNGGVGSAPLPEISESAADLLGPRSAVAREQGEVGVGLVRLVAGLHNHPRSAPLIAA